MKCQLSPKFTYIVGHCSHYGVEINNRRPLVGVEPATVRLRGRGCCGDRPPPTSSSPNLAHLSRGVADELARGAPPLLDIPRGGGTYFAFGRPCYVYSARCSAKTRMCSECALVRSDQKPSIGAYFIHFPKPLCLTLDKSHYSFLLPYVLLHTAALLLNVRLALDRTSLSKASALASDHAQVCYRLFWVPAQLQHPYVARPPSALNVDPPCAQRPSKTALWDKGSESGRAPPPHTHATRHRQNPYPNP